MQKEVLPLSIGNKKLYILRDRIEQNIFELEGFLSGNNYMNSKEFSEKVLFSQEIKENNTIEGYKDDVELVSDVINKKIKLDDKNKVQRIKNLYNGYRYILKGESIDKDSLKVLYSILSKNLLSKYDISRMGDYYRKDDVYIFFSSNLDVEPDKGYAPEKLEEYMDEYFDYVNSYSKGNTLTDHFIKSQIMHFQFVNIHPYFDINGRTSRTLAMWYLLNNKVYPYIIFNRGINLNKNEYYKVIREVKMYNNVTFFINYMLNNIRLELEKEYIIDMIKSQNKDLGIIDYQTLLYILSMKSNLTVKDFTTFYNRHNDKKKVLEIYKTMLEPLIERNIIVKLRDTKGNINLSESNFLFELNKSMYENDPNKIKKLTIK